MPINHSKHLVFDGQIFSRLTVLGFSHNDKRCRRHYLTRCECGTEKTVQGTLLRSGNTKSCGCLGKDLRRATRLPNDIGVIRQIILQYQRHAKSRRIEWQLSEKDVCDLIILNCHYCGAIPSNKKTTKNRKEGYLYSGIDRVDSSQSYRRDNCVPCCDLCNKAKSNLAVSSFLEWAERVHAHQCAMAAQWGAL